MLYSVESETNQAGRALRRSSNSVPCLRHDHRYLTYLRQLFVQLVFKKLSVVEITSSLGDPFQC